MYQIRILADDGLIKKEYRTELEDIFRESGLNFEYVECDTHAKGGVIWFATGLIIAAVGMTAQGFFSAVGEDLYNKLKELIKDSLKNPPENTPGIGVAYISFINDGIEFYFEFSEFMMDNYDEASSRILADNDRIASEFRIISKKELENIHGEFTSVTLRFDENSRRWIVAHYNLLVSI
ncbi:MAG: hypothetical protein WBP40_01000 [Candidatus Moraniibacteriota bacterium]